MKKTQQQGCQGLIFSNSIISELGKGVNSEVSMSADYIELFIKLLQVIKWNVTPNEPCKTKWESKKVR